MIDCGRIYEGFIISPIKVGVPGFQLLKRNGRFMGAIEWHPERGEWMLLPARDTGWGYGALWDIHDFIGNLPLLPKQGASDE